eukprot:Sspe_Gene.216::Locus_76_Transcript_49_57_Confidence_0.034_Length_459::g.216::m.216/K02943/RP-LP2, RPLP2; large subunit ribosomal protein LP2
MKYIAAYLLAQTAGIEEPTAKDVKKIVTDVGGEVDGDRVDELFKQLEGKNVKELIEEAMKKLANVGGGAPAAGGAAPASKPPLLRRSRPQLRPLPKSRRRTWGSGSSTEDAARGPSRSTTSPLGAFVRTKLSPKRIGTRKSSMKYRDCVITT